MRKSRFNDSQRQAIIDSYLSGKKTVEAICEENQISPATFYKWKNEVEVDKHEDKRRIRDLEQENLRLKKMYAELQLKHEVVSEAVSYLKKVQAQSKPPTNPTPPPPGIASARHFGGDYSFACQSAC